MEQREEKGKMRKKEEGKLRKTRLGIKRRMGKYVWFSGEKDTE